MTKILGLTGPTGAGKTTVSRLFAEQGCIILDCDKIAREVTAYHVDCLKDLCYAFGSDIVNEKESSTVRFWRSVRLPTKSKRKS